MCVSDGCEKKVPALYQHPRAYVRRMCAREFDGTCGDDSSSSISVRTVIISTGKRRLRRHWRPGRFSRARTVASRACENNRFNNDFLSTAEHTAFYCENKCTTVLVSRPCGARAIPVRKNSRDQRLPARFVVCLRGTSVKRNRIPGEHRTAQNDGPTAR